jgi:hypothetical protein
MIPNYQFITKNVVYFVLLIAFFEKIMALVFGVDRFLLFLFSFVAQNDGVLILLRLTFCFFCFLLLPLFALLGSAQHPILLILRRAEIR